MQFAAMLLGEVEIRQHLGLAVVAEGGELWLFRPQLIGDIAQHCAHLDPIRYRKACRCAAATILCWVFETYARALRIQSTRQRCQPAPNTRRTAALSPS